MQKRVFNTLFTLLTLIGIACNAVQAQDYVGVLPEILKPEVSQKLGLSDEQREQIQGLIRTRTSAAIGLGQVLREAPASQHDQLRAEFNAESEKMGFQLLDAEQQKLLAKHRVNWMGMLSLGDEEVAKALNLADWQKETVAEWVEKVRANRRGSAAVQTRSDAERAIRQEISESQWANWQVLAGQIESTDAGPAMPPEPKTAPEPTSVAAATPKEIAASADNSELPVDAIQLEMNFQATPWNDVVKWLSQQADFSLQTDISLPGSFTFRDRSRKYSVTEAMDIMNASLLNTGYTLLRQGRMLRVIDFEKDQDKRGELIGELADYVDEKELARRGDYEPVKHMFNLSRLDPDTLKIEAEQLLSIQGSARSLPSSRQLLVIDMAGNVRAIAAMINLAEGSGSSSVHTYPLKSITAEEVLMVVRPLIGLEEEQNKNDEISISTNAFGTTIYALGKADKIQILEDLVKQMDVPPNESESTIEVEKLSVKRHKVVGIDMQLAYEIVSQLLAGSPDVKLAQDAVAKQLVLDARPSEHKLVDDTLAELAGEASDFEVIQLNHLDTLGAIEVIKKFFSLPDTPAADGSGPIIDGNVLARQLWVRGTATQVAEIKSLVERLEENSTTVNPGFEDLVMIPLTGASALQAVEQAELLWNARNGGANPIRKMIPSDRSSTGITLPQKTYSEPLPKKYEARASEPAQEAAQPASDPQAMHAIPRGKFTVAPQQEPSASDANSAIKVGNGKPGEIIIMQGPGGLIITSDDKVALAEFNNLLRMMADTSMLSGGDPVVVYLRNRKADAAKELLEAILSGTTASSSSSSGGLLGDMAGAVLGGFGGGMFGGMLGGSGGSSLASSSTGIATGDYSITTDPWLNALIIKASPADMRLIEQLLQVIDQAEGPLTIETQGQMEIIPVQSQDAEQMLTLIKQVFADRIEGNSSSGGGGRGGAPGGAPGGGGQGGGQPNPADIIAALRGGGGGGRGGGAASKLTEPKIAIGVETITNSLVVYGQPKQIEEIKNLVSIIDIAGKSEQEDIATASLDGVVSGTVFKDSIGRILGPKAVTNTSGGSSSPSGAANSNSGGGSNSSDDAATQARRAAFAEMLQQRIGGGGGGPPGGGGGPGGGGFGGRGGGPGGGGFGGFGGGGPGGGGFGGRGGSPQGGGRGGN